MPLHPQLRTVLEEWISDRAQRPGAAATPALFLNRRGTWHARRLRRAEGRRRRRDLEFGRDGDLTPHESLAVEE